MREILFRGKRIDNGEWVYGYYICKQDPLLPGIDTNVIVTSDENSMSVWNKADPSSVSQYTGLTDKNSVKIFEGDICEIDRECGRFEIIWDNRYTRFALVSDELYFDFDQFNSNEISVIGNIHDNLGLLEGVEND